jgi:hypothetical protein
MKILSVALELLHEDRQTNGCKQVDALKQTRM